MASGTANGTSTVNYTVVVDTMDGGATVLNLSEDIYIVSRCRCETKPKHLNQSINQSIYSFSPMQEVAGIYTDIYYTYWTWYYS